MCLSLIAFHATRRLVSFSQALRGLSSAFYRSEAATVSLETLAVFGIVALPVIVFLVRYASDVVDWVADTSPELFDEADQLF